MPNTLGDAMCQVFALIVCCAGGWWAGEVVYLAIAGDLHSKMAESKAIGGLGEAIILSAIPWLASITVLLIPFLPSAASPLPPYFSLVQSLIASAYIISMLRGIIRGRKASILKLAEELPWRSFLHSTRPSDFGTGEEVEK